jgi:hypothetical protein
LRAARAVLADVLPLFEVVAMILARLFRRQSPRRSSNRARHMPAPSFACGTAAMSARPC